jgi:hypothetical protein
MANERYIYRLRTDIDGVAQITDLVPNTSRRPAVLKGQSGYLPGATDDNSVAGLAASTVAAITGLSAYLLDVTNDEVSGFQISVANADAAATALIALGDAGTAITDAALNTILVTTLGMGAATLPYPNAAGTAGTVSVGTFAGLMQAICGAVYTLPAGSTVNAGAVTAQEGSFNGTFRQLYSSGAFSISLGEGDLATYSSAAFSYMSVTGAACVVYGDDGSVLS